jgi:hypothetical protein
VLKISRNGLGEYNKSCSSPHQESRKIKFAFVWFSYDFLENLQDSAIWIYYWRCAYAPRPLELSESHNSVRSSHPGPWKEKEPYNWVLAAGHRRSGLDSDEAALGLGRGTAGRRFRAHLRSNRGRRRGWSGAGELGWRCGAALAAAAWVPARRRRGWRKARRGEVLQVTRKGCACVHNFVEGARSSSPRRQWKPRRRTASGKDARDRRRCLNRPGSRGHDLGGEMLLCYGVPRCAYGATTGRRVARGLRCTTGHMSAWERSASQVVCGLGQRWPRAWTSRRCGRVGAVSWRDVVARGAGRHEFVLLIPCLSTNNSQFCNKSVPNDEYESCRSSYPPPLSKRLYSVFSINFAGRACQHWMPLSFIE